MLAILWLRADLIFVLIIIFDIVYIVDNVISASAFFMTNMAVLLKYISVRYLLYNEFWSKVNAPIDLFM